MPRITTNQAVPRWIVDHKLIGRRQGDQIAWSELPDEYRDHAGRGYLPAGIILSEAEAGPGLIPRSLATGPAIGVLLTDAVELGKVAARTGSPVLVAGAIYTDLLPETAKAGQSGWILELEARGIGSFVWSEEATDTSYPSVYSNEFDSSYH